MKKVLRIVLWFSLSLACIFFSALYLIGKPLALKHSAKIKPYSRVFQTDNILEARGETSNTLVFFLGDSSVAQPPWARKDTPHIPALLETELRNAYPERGDVSVIEWSFAGGRLFHYYCLLFEAERYSPSLLIIPINWRNLGPSADDWNKKFAFAELSASVPFSERAHASGKSILQLERISPFRQFTYVLQRPMLYVTGLKLWLRTALGMEPEGDSSRDMLDLLPAAEELIGRFSDRRLFSQYTNTIGADNRQLHVLQALADTAARRGIKLLFYITPIHMEEMRRRSRFKPARFQASIERVIESATSETTRCLDLSDLLAEDDFIDYFEHYSPEGNRKIAFALTPAVHEFIESPAPATGKAGPLAMKIPPS